MTEDMVFLLWVLVAWAALYLASRLTDLKRFGVDVKPFLVTKDSPKMREFLDRLSGWNRRVWLAVFNITTVVAALMMAYAVYFLYVNIQRLVSLVGRPVMVMPALPGITIHAYWVPYFMAAALVVILSHEMAHGVAARVHNIPVKSAGVFLVFVLPGGFVEPDEEKFEKAPVLQKLHVLSAGPVANFVIALLVFLLLSSCFAASSGVFVMEVAKNSPADAAGIGRWDVIYAINGTPIRSAYDYYVYVNSTVPGESLLLETNRGVFRVVVRNCSGRACLGINRYYNFYPLRLRVPPQVSIHAYLTAYWTFLISGSAAIFNMLPLYPFDGERFLYSIVERLLGRGGKWVRGMLNVVCFSLFLLNMLLSLFRFGFRPI
ncbi:hypothetical protein DRO48_03565 [Candidatus Bathyarchaeota archaeon]|nr:MAG: hypothetical protein DRO48_03565 [Candidatus Bathyarchaeota archaeon]